MATNELRGIPRVELADLTSSKARAATAEIVERGLRDIGFLFVRTPGLAERLRVAYATYADLFDRPEDELLRYRRPDIHHLRGYTPLGAETAVACRRSGRTGDAQPDHRSGWLIGPESISDPSLPERFPAFYADNVWPDDAEAFREVATALYDELDSIGKSVLRALEPRLGFRTGYFDDITRDASTALRPLHYPPVTPDQVGDIVWGCRHTDGNLVSVLPPSTRTGLKVKVRGGGWIDAIAPVDHTIVQVGDMLQYLTGGYLRSAVHRIDAPDHPTEVARYSSALFIYPRADVDLQPETRWGADAHRSPAQTAAEFFEARLRSIGLDRDSAGDTVVHSPSGERPSRSVSAGDRAGQCGAASQPRW